MTSLALLILVIAVVALVLIGVVVGFVVRGRKPAPLPDTHTDVVVRPEAGTDTEAPPVEVSAPPATIEKPESTASRLVRLRQRLAGAQGGFGRGLLSLLSRERLDEDTWESIEDVLLTADLGVGPTQQVVDGLRTRLRVEGAPPDPKAALRAELVTARGPDHGPTPPGQRGRRQAGRRPRGRCQRHRQDHDGRQAGPDPGGRGPHRHPRGRRHVPRGGRRPARHLG